jgi:formate dehydrogenase iron-sulfur subunit
MTQYTFIFDTTRCIDCRACMVACSVENKIAMNKTRIWVSGVGVTGEFPKLGRATMVYHCMHCAAPDCLSACPVGAYTKREDGPVIYDPKKCIGCRYCMNACPFGVPHFDFDKGLVEGAFIDKCTMCPQRLDVGLEPACVATCPTEALVFGDRTDLLKEAHARIQAHPGRYIDHVYGESENGGTSYLILSHVPFAQLDLPDVGNRPVKEISEKLVGLTIPTGLGLAAVLTAAAVGVNLINRRSERLAGPANKAEVPAEPKK